MEIRLARHGRHIAIVTIDHRPRLNAMTRAMLAELGRLWDELQRDESCRAIVLTGAGTRAFTVGADISGDLSAGPEIARMINHALLKTDAYAKPIIAAVNGDCIGGGLELMLASDVRAAAPEARFGLTEVKWSIYPFGGSTTKLVQQLGYVHAMDLLLTARLIDAEEARDRRRLSMGVRGWSSPTALNGSARRRSARSPLASHRKGWCTCLASAIDPARVVAQQQMHVRRHLAELSIEDWHKKHRLWIE